MVRSLVETGLEVAQPMLERCDMRASRNAKNKNHVCAAKAGRVTLVQ